MSAYNPPLDDMQFLLYDVLGFKHPEIDRDTAGAILEEAAKLSAGILAPLNKIGDQEGARLENGQVYTAKGFKEAYRAYCDGGWNAVPFDPQYGGQGLPYALAFPIQEMWQASNISFGLCPLLNQGAVEAILAHGTQSQKDFYLPKLISGEWTGTMNLTEANAGSDLGMLRTRAELMGDGTYKISGQKIFITYGDHDMADNIIHLVLARISDAPEDVKGISLFIVPKVLQNGERNAVSCIGLEHKLGIHASPTCTMSFDGAVGYIVGAEHQGLKYMFTMMNNARLCVGLQGVAIAERAYQHALAYAKERMQGKALSSGERVAIAKHPDVKRMLMTMRAHILAGRALAYRAAIALDAAEQQDDNYEKASVDLLTPIVKGYCTDMAVEVASLGIQVHGGMGFIEETGAAQYYRDARILPIYEGTNGIQASDLVFRKVLRDDGSAVFAFVKEISDFSDAIDLKLLKDVTSRLVALKEAKNMDEIAWMATPYLKGFSIIAGASMLCRMKKIGGNEELTSLSDFYQCNILPFSRAHLGSILG